MSVPMANAILNNTGHRYTYNPNDPWLILEFVDTFKKTH